MQNMARALYYRKFFATISFRDFDGAYVWQTVPMIIILKIIFHGVRNEKNIQVRKHKSCD